jgi:hypothetical protein
MYMTLHSIPYIIIISAMHMLSKDTNECVSFENTDRCYDIYEECD